VKGPPTIETHRLLLRAPDASDVDPLFAIQGDPVAMRFTYCSPSRAATQEFLESYSARFAIDGFAPWTAVLSREGGVVGWGGLNRDPKAPHWGVEVTYFIDPAFAGRGLASELLQASLALAFRDLDLPGIGAFVRPENRASVRVLAKAGFTRRRFVAELQRDQYSISASQWSPVALSSSSQREVSIRLLEGALSEMTELQRVLEEAPAYSQRITGLPPGPADAQSTYSALPPDKTYDDKFVFGIWSAGAMIGVIDVIRGYPRQGTAFLGLLLLSEKHQGRGHGRAAYRLVEEVIRGWGTCRRVRLSVVRVNAEVIPFWESLGFQTTGEVKPYRYASILSEHLLFEKVL
jgi:RimJ/RimL family protein N-acetyltransferase